MKVLVVGGAGYVASIVNPALEALHEVRYLDIVPVPGRKRATVVGDVLDERAVVRAVRGCDAVVYLAMGMPGKVNRRAAHKDANYTEPAWRVNAAGFFQVAHLAMWARIRRFVYCSSMSVYGPVMLRPKRRDESDPPDAFFAYGISKRAGELVGDALAQAAPSAVVVSLRVWGPRNAEDLALAKRMLKPGKPMLNMGPLDTQRLFVAALKVKQRGHHIIQATGDVEERWFSHDRARKLLNWSPRGE